MKEKKAKYFLVCLILLCVQRCMFKVVSLEQRTPCFLIVFLLCDIKVDVSSALNAPLEVSTLIVGSNQACVRACPGKKQFLAAEAKSFVLAGEAERYPDTFYRKTSYSASFYCVRSRKCRTSHQFDDQCQMFCIFQIYSEN